MMDDDSAWLTAKGRLLQLCLLSLAIGVGFGFVMRRVGGKAESAPNEGIAVAEGGQREAAASGATVRSNDTVAGILADTSATQYGRLALWLLDASSDEMEDMFWGLLAQRGADESLFKLLFDQWAKIDPRGAIEASKDTEHAGLAWWAWGKIEPETALAAALEKGDEAIAMTLRGIGQVDPELAIQLMEELPKPMHYWDSVEGIADGFRQTDPARAVEFARQFGYNFPQHMADWGKRDPRGFLAWSSKNEVGDSLSDGARLALKVIALEHPRRIGELAATLPTGMLRKGLLQSAVRALAKNDQEAAIALADREKGETMRRDLYATIGTELARVDPVRSLELLRETEALGYTLYPWSVYSPGGGGSEGYSPVVHWLRTLAETMPEETITTLREIEGLQNPYIEANATEAWVNHDQEGFATWLEGEAPSPQRDANIRTLVQRMTISGEQDYPSMIDWSSSIGNEASRNSSIWNVLGDWVNKGSRAEAERYFESPDVPEVALERWNKFVEQNPAP